VHLVRVRVRVRVRARVRVRVRVRARARVRVRVRVRVCVWRATRGGEGATVRWRRLSVHGACGQGRGCEEWCG